MDALRSISQRRRKTASTTTADPVTAPDGQDAFAKFAYVEHEPASTGDGHHKRPISEGQSIEIYSSKRGRTEQLPVAAGLAEAASSEGSSMRSSLMAYMAASQCQTGAPAQLMPGTGQQLNAGQLTVSSSNTPSPLTGECNPTSIGLRVTIHLAYPPPPPPLS